MSDVHVNDVGTVFEVTVVDENNAIVNLSASSVIQIRFTKPDATVFDRTAAFKTDGIDGIIQYTTIADDIDQKGDWCIQAHVEFTTPVRQWTSDADAFPVLK